VNGAKDITVIGTCFEYGMQEGELLETMPALPTNPYGLAKDTLRKQLEELNKFYPFSLKWPRLFYMYGVGQNPKSLFSQLEVAIERGDTVFNMSGGEQVRDFLPVEEIAANIVTIALQNKIEGVINCSSGIPKTVKTLVGEYLVQQKATIQLNLGFYPYPDYEPMRFWGNIEKLTKIKNNE
jgi:dTDP-6-deoxy-L-talose 4-dehydrogenase (NAD+)